MPVISMFHGILIRMYTLDTVQHNMPHIHARFAEFEAVFEIASAEVLAGELPRKQTRLVQAWMELRRADLEANWALASAGVKPFRIEPL